MLRYKCLQPFWVAKKNSLGNSRTKCYKNVKGFTCKQSNFLPFHITSERPSRRFFRDYNSIEAGYWIIRLNSFEKASDKCVIGKKTGDTNLIWFYVCVWVLGVIRWLIWLMGIISTIACLNNSYIDIGNKIQPIHIHKEKT